MLPQEETTLPPQESSARSRVVCLLPARNAAADLPGFFESAARFCDAVVALDDGSTDNTRELLEACPLVKVLLTNPSRDDYRGWDDSANRNRLLSAAAELNPEWIISIDADERIDPGDAAALRDFLEQDALPGCAYGFQVFATQKDLEHYSPEYLWVYRLFAHEPGQSFPDQRLHFVPVPTSIPRALWIRTTLRIQHTAGATPERRRARFEKYRQADPDNDYQVDYTNLLQEPSGDLLRWELRPPELHVLLDAVDESDVLPIIEEPTDGPAVSAIVISRDDETRIARAVASVVNQSCPEPFEVIVVTSGTDRTAEVVRKKFPDVTLVELPRPALPGEARNAGLRLARGAYITFPDSHVELHPTTLAARLRAHRLGYTMVTGATLNGTHTWAGWTAYFLDHAANLPGQPLGVVDGPPAHCSYARGPLLEVGGFPEDLRAGEDTTVNMELFSRGYLAYHDPQVRFTHHNPCHTPRQLARHYFVRGKGLGRIVLRNTDERAGLLLDRRFLKGRLLGYLPQRLRWTLWNVVRWGGPEYRRLYARVFPLVVAGSVAAWLGMWYEILRPTAGKSSILLGQPAGDLHEKLSKSWRDVGTKLRKVKRRFTLDGESRNDLLVLVDKKTSLPANFVLPAGTHDIVYSRRTVPNVVPDPPKLNVKAWALTDLISGLYLAGENPDEQVHIASVTKMMSALVVLKEGGDLDEQVTVSEQAESYVGLTYSNVGLIAGERLTIRDLLMATLIASGADAVYALAEHLGNGSVDSFVKKMNTEASSMGLDNTCFETPAGFDTTGNYSSARDLATLAREALKYPLFAEIVRTKDATISTQNRQIRIFNWNQLLSTYPKATGVKTGTSPMAGANLVASAEDSDEAYIAVILGASDSEKRVCAAQAALEYGFNRYERRVILPGWPTVDKYQKLSKGWHALRTNLRRAKRVFATIGESYNDLLMLVDRKNALPDSVFHSCCAGAR